jgi:8-oxo-dGTP pyrophosphatase MutT (NUDIX family)
MRWGSRGAGILVVACDTGRILMLKRSEQVNEPGTWGFPGGKIDPRENARTAASRELGEETGYDGPLIVSAEPIFVFEEPNFKFMTYMGRVEEEFDPWLNWESDDAKWVQLGRWPRPLHFGVKALVAAADVEREVEQICGPDADRLVLR